MPSRIGWRSFWACRMVYHRMTPFGRVFARLDAVQFEACFTSWVQHLHELTAGQLVGN